MTVIQVLIDVGVNILYM